MPYDPTEPTPKDVIRGWAGDTSNDPMTEIVKDETYLATLERFGAGSGLGDPTDTAPFYRAAADLLRRVAVVLQAKPSSISAPQDGSVGWSSRTSALEAKAKQLVAHADELEAADEGGFWGPVVTVRSNFLTGEGGRSW